MNRQAVIDELGALDETAWTVVLEQARAILRAYVVVAESDSAKAAIAVIDAALEQDGE